MSPRTPRIRSSGRRHPVSTYLMGYAVAQGADPREVTAVIARLAREFDV